MVNSSKLTLTNDVIQRSDVFIEEMKTILSSIISGNTFYDSGIKELMVRRNTVSNNSSTIKNIRATDINYDAEYYQNIADLYFKKAEIVSHNLPQVITVGSNVNADVYVKNLGMFFSWTADKNIQLHVEIRDKDNELEKEFSVNLDTAISQNLPGLQSQNKDFEKIKVFSFPILFNMLEGTYVIILEITKDGVAFQTPQYNTVYVSA